MFVFVCLVSLFFVVFISCFVYVFAVFHRLYFCEIDSIEFCELKTHTQQIPFEFFIQVTGRAKCARALPLFEKQWILVICTRKTISTKMLKYALQLHCISFVVIIYIIFLCVPSLCLSDFVFCAFLSYFTWWPVNACDIFGFIDAVASVIFNLDVVYASSLHRCLFFDCPSKQDSMHCKRSAILVSSRTLIFNWRFFYFEHSFASIITHGLC